MEIIRFLKNINIYLVTFVASLSITACGGDDNEPGGNNPTDTPTEPVPDNSTFAKGVDMSWLTKMESEGLKFYASGSKAPDDAMKILRDSKSVDAIRLRVWVDPTDKWNNIDDVLIKARRAHNLGLRIMIDFHFSDTWADPAHQAIPASWKNHDIESLKAEVEDHVNQLLSQLKREGITPEWVQIGNEITQGMLLPTGSVDNPSNLTQLINSGYDAVKGIFHDTKVIVHLDRGEDEWRYNNLFGKINNYGAKYDMIGMSLYPESPSDENPSDWRTITDKCLSNIRSLYRTYGKPIMICEVGMHYTKGDMAREWLSYLRTESEKLGYVEGIFYWEPQAPAGYNNGYFKGCFIDGSPTSALDF